jgi:hypothetical protein
MTRPTTGRAKAGKAWCILVMGLLRCLDRVRQVRAFFFSCYAKRKQFMNAAKITLLLLKGEANSLRTAEIGNWTGMAIAAPRTELDDLLKRQELDRAGVYILSGIHSDSGVPRAYIGEAENIYERLKQHKTNEFWVSVIVFTSRDDNLTKAHVRYLEQKLLTEAAKIGRFNLEQNQAGGSRLPECDREVMEDFLYRIRQLLPILGSELLIPARHSPTMQQPASSEVNPNKASRPSTAGLGKFIYELKQKGKTLTEVIEIGQKGKYAGLSACWFKDRWSKTPRSAKTENQTGGTMTAQGEILFCPMKGAEARGHRFPDGDRFAVLKGSTAVLRERASSEKWPKWMAIRRQLIADGTLVEKDDLYEFTSSFVFSSPSAAATVIHGGPANGLTAWRSKDGKQLKQLDKQT